MDDISFHMILPTTIVKQVFGNPVTSKQINRFPVVPKHAIRYVIIFANSND